MGSTWPFGIGAIFALALASLSPRPASAQGQPSPRLSQPPPGEERVDPRMLADLDLLRDLEMLRELDVLQRMEQLTSGRSRPQRPAEKPKP